MRSKLRDFEFVAPKKMSMTKIKAVDIETTIRAIDELIKEKKGFILKPVRALH